VAYRKPKSIEEAVLQGTPELVISMGCEVACPTFPGATHQDWDLQDPAGKPIDFMRRIRDEVEENVKKLVQELVD
jgi:protein-tyrosine-phosphatase